MRTSRLLIVLMYPELLGTYGDGGNALVLHQRLAFRGLEVTTVEVRAGEPVPEGGDVYVLGGGEDLSQLPAAAELRASRGFRRAVNAGAQVLAVCAGFQLLGEYFTGVDGTRTDGLGLLDARTRPLAKRAVGEVQAVPAAGLGLPMLSGFENHRGGTSLGPAAKALATVHRSTALDAGRGRARPSPAATEGAIQANIIATYLHGPVLARNPALADLLLGRALGAVLPPLDIPAVHTLRSDLGVAPSTRPPPTGALRPGSTRVWCRHE